MTKYKVGIIGCGRIAGYLEDDPLRFHPCTHVGAYKSLPNCDVVACCSRNEENVKLFAHKFSIKKYYTDYRKMLDNEPLDIISVATYAPSHCDIVVEAAQRNLKGIFCEKAMATSLEEADKMIQACERNGVILSVNHTRRWQSDFIKAKEMIKQGAIGELQTIYGNFSGNILHTGVHMFDIIIYFAGDPQMVWGLLKEGHEEFSVSSGYKFQWDNELMQNIEDKDGFVTILFKSGVVAQLFGIGKRYFVFELDIQGTEGRIRIGNGIFEYYKMAKSPRNSDYFELKKCPVSIPSAPSALVSAVEDLISGIEGKKETKSSGREARKSLEVALSVYESDRCGSCPVRFPFTNTSLKVISR